LQKKILIIGGNGIIGSKFVDYFKERNSIFHSTFFQNASTDDQGMFLDIRDQDNVEKIITKIQPDVVIHNAALAVVDKCETDRELAYSINVKGTENILKSCEKISTKIVYVSTTGIFDGSKDEYFENDEPSPINYYGETKTIAENKIQESELNYLILRTDQPYCWTEKWQRLNSVIRILNNFSSNKIHNEVSDWYNKPTFVLNFIENAMKLIDTDSSGIFHVVGSDFINRLDWSMALCDVFGLDKSKITKILSNELNLPAKRSNVNANNEKVTRKTGIPMIGVKDGAKLMFKERHND